MKLDVSLAIAAALVVPFAASGCAASVPISSSSRSTASKAGKAPIIKMIRSPHRGALPDASTTSIAGVDLPPGEQVSVQGSDGPPVLWVSSRWRKDAGALAARLMTVYATTGLWPLVLQDGNDSTDGSPWLTGEFDSSPSTPLNTDPVKEFADGWSAHIVDEDTDDHAMMMSFGSSFPGLGQATGPVSEDVVKQTSRQLGGRLGLVAVQRPADALARIGWQGATNYYDAGAVSVALRSWEDRYGAELVRVGYDYIQLAVRNPPRDDQGARKLAAEHFAISPDTISQNDDGDTPDEYARSLKGSNNWYLWWD